MKQEPLTTAGCKAACTDNALDPPTRSLIGSSAPDHQPKHNDGEVISTVHRILFAVHACSDTARTVRPILQLLTDPRLREIHVF